MSLESFYEDCGCADHEHEVITLAAAGDDTPELPEWINNFLKAIHAGDVLPGQIDPDYYGKVSKELLAGAAEGLGGSTFGAADFKNTLKAFLDQNIYSFSSARSLYMLEQYRSFLTDAQGNILSEAQFISKVADVAFIDNITYLKTERNSAMAMAQMAEKWEGLQAFPALEYRTVEDFRVRPEHAVLDRLILATEDPFWNTIYPPNGWNCRCIVVPAAGDAELSPKQDAYDKIKAANVQPYFKRNVGKEKMVYSNDHPYIEKVGVKKLNELDAEKNYGLRSGEKIYDQDDLPGFKPVQDKATANAWWQDMAGSARGSFDLKSVDDLAVTFDNEFRNHVLEGNKEDRFRIIKQLKDVLQNPDEVWSNRLRDTLQNTYIKYYESGPVILAVEAEKKVRAISMYEIKHGDNINFDSLKKKRKGILKYRTR